MALFLCSIANFLIPKHVAARTQIISKDDALGLYHGGMGSGRAPLLCFDV
jgi:hypothetical protein